jgi:hypothetical protein
VTAFLADPGGRSLRAAFIAFAECAIAATLAATLVGTASGFTVEGPITTAGMRAGSGWTCRFATATAVSAAALIALAVTLAPVVVACETAARACAPALPAACCAAAIAPVGTGTATTGVAARAPCASISAERAAAARPIPNQPARAPRSLSRSLPKCPLLAYVARQRCSYSCVRGNFSWYRRRDIAPKEANTGGNRCRPAHPRVVGTVENA